MSLGNEVSTSMSDDGLSVKERSSEPYVPEDVAAKILAEEETANMFSGNPWTPTEDKALVRKLDWILVPTLYVCATLSGTDKVAIGTASIMGLREDCHLSGHQYSWIGSIPYFGGLFWMAPAAYLIQRLPSSKFFAFNIFAWGLASLCMAACNSFAGLMVCRFILGAAEAIVSPACTLFMTMYYKTHEQPPRMAIILSVTSSIWNGLVSYGANQYTGGVIEKWRLLFIVLGVFTILWSIGVVSILPDNPSKARWLSSRQKVMVIKRMATARATGVENKSFKSSHIVETLKDYKTWVLFFYFIAANVPNGGLITFNGIIINGLGFDPIETSLLSIPTGIMSTLTGIVGSYFAGKTHRFRTVIIACMILLPLTGAAVVYGTSYSNTPAQMVGLYILYGYWGPYVTGVTVYQANTAGHTKKLAVYSIMYIAYAAGNLIGPQTFIESQAPEYTGGIIGMFVCYIMSIVLILGYGLGAKWENMARDRKAKNDEQYRPGQHQWQDLTDKQNISFRYTT